MTRTDIDPPEPEPYEEMSERIAYCRRMKKRSLKHAIRWRRLLRTSGKGMEEFCRTHFDLAWQDVGYWVICEKQARGQ